MFSLFEFQCRLYRVFLAARFDHSKSAGIVFASGPEFSGIVSMPFASPFHVPDKLEIHSTAEVGPEIGISV